MIAQLPLMRKISCNRRHRTGGAVGLRYRAGQPRLFGRCVLLARALRTAGARNMMVILWKLNDGEACDFVIAFDKT